jgi:dimethylamine/trimethylamine dehydrogenase
LNDEYLKTLLLYYEEEIMGEGYFLALSKYFDEKHEQDKMVVMAQVESYAAKAVLPLLKKYNLKSRAMIDLRLMGEQGVAKVRGLSWKEFMLQICNKYPDYLTEFTNLENMAPKADLPLLKVLTHHEVVAIEFAKLEINGSKKSIEPLTEYMGWS